MCYAGLALNFEQLSLSKQKDQIIWGEKKYISYKKISVSLSAFKPVSSSLDLGSMNSTRWNTGDTSCFDNQRNFCFVLSCRGLFVNLGFALNLQQKVMSSILYPFFWNFLCYSKKNILLPFFLTDVHIAQLMAQRLRVIRND